MDPSSLGPLDWFAVPANGQGVVIALIVACCVSVVTLVYKNVGLTLVLLGIVMSALFTVMAIPLAVSYFRLAWQWWPFIGLANGVASLRIVRGLDALASRLEKRLPDAAADRVTAMVRGGATPDQPPGGS